MGVSENTADMNLPSWRAILETAVDHADIIGPSQQGLAEDEVCAMLMPDVGQRRNPVQVGFVILNSFF